MNHKNTFLKLVVLGLGLFPFTGYSQTSSPQSFTWTNGGVITTGGEYDITWGQIRRRVTDIQVTGSIGDKPLEWTRILRQVNSTGVNYSTYFGTVWSYSYCYKLIHRVNFNIWDNPIVEYPTGVSVTFEPSPTYGIYRMPGCADHLVENLNMATGNSTWEIRCGDGSTIYLEPLAGGVENFYPVRIVDSHGLQTFIAYDNNYYGINPSQITDASGRWIKIEYMTVGYMRVPYRVYSSDGQEVNYDWEPDTDWLKQKLSRARYSDGTEATYSYTGGYGYGWALPSTCRDTRCPDKIHNILYEFDILSQYQNAAYIKYVKNADNGVLVSYRQLVPNQYPHEVRGDGALRTFRTTGSLILWETDFRGNTLSYAYQNGFLVSKTDARGNAIQYENEPIYGKVTKVTYPDGSFESVSYSSGHPTFVTSQTNTRGYATTYERLSNGLISRTNYPDGSSERWTYGAWNLPSSHVLQNGSTEYFDYDSNARLVTHTLSTGGQIRYEYYEDGSPWKDRVRRAIDPRGFAVTYEYDLLFSGGVQTGTPCAGRGLVSKITNSDGTYRTYGYNVYGDKVWEEDELRNRTTYAYDWYSRLKSMTDPLGHTTQIFYGNSESEEASHTFNAPSRTVSPAGRVATFSYDADKRLAQKIEGAGTGDEKVWRFEYDQVGNPTKTREQIGGSTGAEQWRDTSYAYDNRNRKITEYAVLGRNTDFQYDTESNMTWCRHPDGAVESKEYDSMNRVSKVIDELGRATNYTFYPSGKIQWILDARNNSYSFTYDAQDRITHFWLTNSGQTGFDYEQTAYDASGNVVGFRNRSGAWKTMSYDGRNRPTSSSWSDGVTPSTSTSYDGTGRITSRSNSNSTTSFSYDSGGRLIEERTALSGFQNRLASYQYDNDGNRTKVRVEKQ